ncbi:MAG: tetratricopeptide repeat protein [Bacillota bacterium]
MTSVEVFCSNVKTILAQRSIRIKDLAERVGLSESYLSLVLNGSRKNLNDEYKDRIASCLNMTLSQLYSEGFGTSALTPDPIFVEDPDRKETIRTVDMFLSSTHLDGARPSFYVALAGLSDRDARTVRSFLSAVLTGLSLHDGTSMMSQPSVMSMPEQERRLLAIYSLAGDSAKLEWVRAAADLDSATFDQVTEGLTAASVVNLVDDGAGRRARVTINTVPASSIYTSRKLGDIHLALAAAMLTYSDEGPYFEKAVAEHFLRAGMPAESLDHLQKAARLMELTGLWREAAGAWHQASILCGTLSNINGRSNCLADAAKCLCAAGEFVEANEFGSYACRLIEEFGEPRSIGYVCIMMGNMLLQHDLGAAIDWYRRGLRTAPLDDPAHGILLGNLASTLLEAGKLDEAENTLKEARRWSVGRDSTEIGSLNVKIPMGLGLIEYQRRNWKLARTHFEDALAQSGSNKSHSVTAWHNLGMLMYRDDNTKMAREYLTKAQDTYWQLGAKVYWAYAAIELAKVALREGDLDEPAGHINAAEPFLEEKSVLAKGWVRLIRACVDRGQRRPNQAIGNGRKAVDIFQRENAERELAVTALWLSSLYQESGDSQQATFLERRAFQIYEKKHWDIRELHRERSLLEPEAR